MFNSYKKDFRSVPLDNLYTRYQSMVSDIEAFLEEQYAEQYQSTLNRTIEKIYQDREDSFEGDNEEDIVRYNGVDPERLRLETSKARKEVVSSFCEFHNMQSSASWFLPQVVAYIAKMDLPRNDKGQVDSVAYAKQFGKDDWHKGLWLLATHTLRGDFVPKQYSPESRSYSALVPLLMMPHKRFNGVKYSSWDCFDGRTSGNFYGLGSIVDRNLFEAMTYFMEEIPDKNTLLKVQRAGLEVMTGAKAGTFRKPETTFKLYNLNGDYKTIPWLAQVILFQIWCAHPVNRSEVMVLDWNTWDNIPEPLINIDVLPNITPPTTKRVRPSVSDIPW